MPHTFLQIEILLDFKLLLPDIRNLYGHLAEVVRNGEQVCLTFFDERGEVYKRGIFGELLLGDGPEITRLNDFVNR